MSVAQRIYDNLISATARAPHSWRRRALSAARRACIALGDPTVVYQLKGAKLELPISHDLPIHRAQHVGYSENLGVIAAALAGRQPGFTVIDVGANVGDSVAILRGYTSCPILCIEGNEGFLSHLARNLIDVPDVEVAETYVGSPVGGDLTTHRVVRARGTARLVPAGTDHDDGITVAALADILDAHPRFASPGLLKLDTDGHDVAILLGAVDLLREHSPTVFLEFDPTLSREVGRVDAYALFGPLTELGYGRWLFHSNVGELLDDLSTRDPATLTARARQRIEDEGVEYLDICALPQGQLAVHIPLPLRSRKAPKAGRHLP